jgi:hypothetical protein
MEPIAPPHVTVRVTPISRGWDCDVTFELPEGSLVLRHVLARTNRFDSLRIVLPQSFGDQVAWVPEGWHKAMRDAIAEAIR